MELREIVAPTMKTLFMKEITRQILSGECKVGEKLPTEREMEKQMKVSRTIIHSALTELARIGFVEIHPRQGVYVGDYIRNSNIDTLVAIINFNDGKLDKKTFDDIVTYRIRTESDCAYLAALNRTEEDLETLHQIYDHIRKTDSIHEIARLKNDFQQAIYHAADNVIYISVFNSFEKVAVAFNEIMFKHLGHKAATQYLPDLITAIENKDADRAKKMMFKLATSRAETLQEHYFTKL